MTLADLPDAGLPARLRHALAGGKRALAADREAAELLAAACPGGPAHLREMGRQANAFHRRAAKWAVLSTPARTVVFAGAGLPPPDGVLHGPAEEAAPGTRIAYAEANGKAAWLMSGALALIGQAEKAPGAGQAAGRLPAVRAGVPENPEAVLGGVPCRPVSVQLVLAAHYWAGEKGAAGILAEYAALLPSGSSVALTCCMPGPRFAEAVSAAAGRPAYDHSPGDIEDWVEAAGMAMHPWGVRDAASWGHPASLVAPGRPWVAEAVALVP